MGMFDKRRFKKLLLFALNFDVRNPRTYQDVDPDKTTTRDLFSRFDLGLDVMEFTGHAIALHTSERWVTGTFVDQIRLQQIFTGDPNLPDLSLVTWTSPVWKPSDASSCTLNLCPATTAVHTCTLCTGWGNYHKGLPGWSDTNSEQM